MCPQKNWGGTLKETVLWTNPNPSSAMGATDITPSPSLSEFKYIKVIYRMSTSNSTTCAVIMDYDDFVNTSTSTFRFAMEAFEPNGHFVRLINRNSDTSINFEIAYQVGNTSTRITAVIPQQVIGLK